MRYLTSTLKLVAVLGVVVTLAACGGGGESTPAADSAAMAPPPPPTPDSYALVGTDGTWSADITPTNITFRRKRGARTDSLVFDFKEPSVNGAISEYTSVMMAADTNRIDITLAMTKCTDKAGAEYSHRAQLWLNGSEFSGTGCANKK